jgi:hypothetical protein
MQEFKTRRDFLTGIAGFGGLAIANRAPLIGEAADAGGAPLDVALRICPGRTRSRA